MPLATHPPPQRCVPQVGERSLAATGLLRERAQLNSHLAKAGGIQHENVIGAILPPGPQPPEKGIIEPYGCPVWTS